MQKMYRACIMRGGTSKGIFIKKNELPTNIEERDKILLRIIGSPDERQIDGLGGANMVTSKLALIGPHTKEGTDIDYYFGQVSITEKSINYKGNCGNISAAVGPYAIDEGFVKPKEPYTKVRIHQVNTNSIIVAKVPVYNGKSLVEGDYQIDGVPGSGAKIELDFSDCARAFTGKLLPTGRTKDRIFIENYGEIECTIIDMANPVVFVSFEQFGLSETERDEESLKKKGIQELVEIIRIKSAEAANLFSKSQDISNSMYPFVALVSSSNNGDDVEENSIQLISRLFVNKELHKTYPITGAVCLAVATKLPETVISSTLSLNKKNCEMINIFHPQGNIEVSCALKKIGDDFLIQKAAVARTARKIMEGFVFVNDSVSIL